MTPYLAMYAFSFTSIPEFEIGSYSTAELGIYKLNHFSSSTKYSLVRFLFVTAYRALSHMILAYKLVGKF